MRKISNDNIENISFNYKNVQLNAIVVSFINITHNDKKISYFSRNVLISIFMHIDLEFIRNFDESRFFYGRVPR